jgi:hypothetical protein
MAAPKKPPPRVRNSAPPSSAPRPILGTAPPPPASVVPIRPRPPAFSSGLPRPVIIEEDVVDYLAKASVDQRWRILSKVAVATRDEPPASSAPPTPTLRTLELVDAEAVTDDMDRPDGPRPDGPREDSRLPPPSIAPAPPPTTPPPPMVPMTPTTTAQASTTRTPTSTIPSPAPPRPSTTPKPPPASAPAVSQSAALPASDSKVDAAEELFEAMHELSQIQGAFAGVRFCLDAAMRAIPCVAGLAHVRDPATRDLVVLHAQGPRADALLGTHNPEGDPLAARAMQAGRPIAVVYGSEPGAETSTCARHAFFDPWGVVLVPVVQGGQLLALLEMIDPVSTNPSDDLAQSALAYVADRLGRFLIEQTT